ncbi:MAG: DUF1080 domain-containing protein [Armatimonadetes bacterium]|nr:DUF1080 domain-containing protein [Armatimonadota bacterium]
MTNASRRTSRLSPVSPRRRSRLAALCAILIATALSSAGAMAQDRAGYSDTPFLPGGKWRVHDAARPDPPPAKPRRGEPGDRPKAAPRGAVVLFDGRNLDAWRTMDGRAPGWTVENGAMRVPPHGTPDGGDIVSRAAFGDCDVLVEWRLPARVPGEERSMNRGNSGVYLMGLFEVQIFDSFGPDFLYADGQAGAIYGQFPPRVDVCRAPGEWQSFDIRFRAPRIRDGKVVEPAIMTVRHNGVVIHDRARLLGPTQHRALAAYGPDTPTEGPLLLQSHGSPVEFRNIWVRPAERSAGVSPAER